MANEHFFPSIEPFATGELAVDDVHTIYFEQCGNPDGQPVLFVHGGPGAGCSTTDRRFFDPEVFRVILVDQRGCNRSRPLGELRDNTIDHLVADFERVREELGIERWHVFGGSWGSTLGMYYAQECPDRTLSLVIRGIWMIRPAELHWWLYEIGQIQPELWDDFVNFLPEEERAIVVNRAELSNDAPVPVSALTGEGCDTLLERIDSHLGAGLDEIDVAVPVEDGRAIAWLYSHGEVLDRADREDAIQLRVRLAPADKARFERMTAE